MVKSAVIFSEKNKEKKADFYKPVDEDSVTLSRKEYRHLIETAYQEGLRDRNGDQKKQKREKATKSAVEQKGKEEAIQLHAKEKEESLQKFKTITARHDIEIMRSKSVFPFTLFPDTLIIDTTKVTIVRQQLFATELITTIPLKDIADVTVQTVLFLGTLMVKYMPQATSPGMTQPVDVKIPNLKREDAIKAKNILKGVLVAKSEEIDIANLEPDEVAKVLQKFGESSGIV